MSGTSFCANYPAHVVEAVGRLESHSTGGVLVRLVEILAEIDQGLQLVAKPGRVAHHWPGLAA